MPQYNITLAKDASNDDLEKAKQHVKDQGGEIVSEFSLIKGFTAKVPDDAISTLQSNDKITVEHDGEVKTQ
ncbi:hypothetical protein HBI56_138230 [Parastagonospora nodorum]|uniref:Inhibitor I9 domain-containing protein n=2 Tax=Phaeosphaeria nodorum (strain SN15 / ATCC MYA-4574 / FGSC 10173) TaxID=321614 RepID=A0A7U2NPC3_PHANO|nr:hypothetical protein SNOG_05863 [Parastagonospora nodorum SN15]KAH3911866.1 hypothetical protein HBH56_129570 [Parastagonospora nodorum]EAT86927.1 hypothetical protein SNOG_05863 [Parastagonospora nodorum SN15]KAH3931423.1 hypothetical protein HBH54_093900 [Parastagonospora nodorum]KAH3947371.1 hypothetical protein HBH53_119880 [Parastagonospora nodorum]KAH3970612.1 hypothetical protein HBH51_116270 [Parastagonospora nodorum]